MSRPTGRSPPRRCADLCAWALAGLRATIGRVLWIERVAFFEAEIEADPDCSMASGMGLDFVVPSADELLSKYLGALEAHFQLNPAKVKERLSRSHVAVLAVHATDPVAMVWLAFTQQYVSEIGRIFVLQPHEVLTYNEFTLPAWRGKGISPTLNRFADAYAAQRGATRRITWRRVGNAPAMRVAEKLGHRLITVVTSVRVAGRWHPCVFGINSTAPRLDLRRL